MNEELNKNANACYRKAEQKAADYFTSLFAQLKEETYISTITKDIHSWKQNHMSSPAFFFFSNRKKRNPDPMAYHSYIRWLDHTGKLDNYLNRSISYIFMRDLGKALDATTTQNRIQQVVASLKKYLKHSTTTNQSSRTEPFSMAGMYELARKEGVESSFFWLIDKLKTVSSNIPKGMNAEEAQRKLIKIIAGVLMHEIEEMGDEISPEERAQKLDKAIRLGYAYGLTYPFIDDILDSDVLSAEEKKQYSDLIRTTLITGSVPELGEWRGNNKKLIHYIHSELRDAFEYIKSHQREATRKHFFEQSYVFFHSQEADRAKDLSNGNYSNEELYIPVILKSASSRLIVRSVLGTSEDEGFDRRTFFYGIYNQLADDFADMFDDMKDGAVTPYTYYMKYHDQRPDLINPFELYWTVISYLIHNVYHSDTKTCEVILDRAINGLKRFKQRMGTEKYNEIMELFASGNPKFNRLIQKMVRKAGNVDFFDKLLRDRIITTLRNERKEREEFSNTVESARAQINKFLPIPETDHESHLNESIIEAANYSLKNDGKRLRPVVSWVMGVEEYGLDKSAIIPLLKSLEYMHTSSLIFDDLPSQDNADIRRGKPTLHQVYNIAISELTGLFLTQKAVEEQASLDGFYPKSVLQLIQYSAARTADMCRGQAMDLGSKGKELTLEELNTMCFYKTGIGFEASLLMPAILAGATEPEMEALKKYAYHAGIAFQIKDDLLDVEGEFASLGKPLGNDVDNNKSTFVSVLGAEEARKALGEHYYLAIEVLQEVPCKTSFLKHLLDYFVNRNY
ncbi:hypothetical protein GCM10027286_22490 [Virgibacillus ainsalahensis]